jgi:SAM-dependent methyltransferase
VLEALETRDVTALYRQVVGVAVDLSRAPTLSYRRCRTCDLRYFDPLLTGDEGFYAELQRHPWYYLEEKTEYQVGARHVGPEDRVLEVGAGSGAFARAVACREYVGLELSQAAVDRARAAGVNVVKEPLERHVEGRTGHYDVVCMYQVLEHVAAPRRLLDDALRALRPGGLLIVSVPSEDSFMGLEVNNALNLPPHHVTRWTDRSLEEAGSLLGAELLELSHEPLADLHLPAYANTVVRQAWLGIRGGRPGLVSRPWGWLPVRALVKAWSWVFAAGLRDERLRPRGHSVTAVYRRPMTGGL